MSRARDVANLGSDTTNLEDISSAYNAGALSNRNKIINGAMVIDQRNAGASVSVGSGTFYGTDRWGAYANLASKIAVQQNAGSVTPPDGYSNYVGITVDAAANVSITSSDVFQLYQSIEGYNLIDIAFGKTNAKPLALSFWVRSSLTGTFSGSLYFGGSVASYPFSYSISAANTWEFKTITIAATSTYAPNNTTNGFGAALTFDLGAGSTYAGTAGAWAAGTKTKATGSVNLVETNSATFYITGVQLEAGDTATPFEHRSYGQELALCQRYYEAGSGRQNIRNPSIADNNPFGALVGTDFRVSKRAAPTIALGTATVSGCYTNSGSTENITTSGFAQILLAQTSGAVSNMTLTQPWTASAEL